MAAAQFARCGWDVSVQYGANQPGYDLVAVDGDRIMKVSVKGSKDGGWGLTQSYLTKGTADYLTAADKWQAKHSAKTVICLVQFHGIPVDALPRIYLATPREVADWLKAAAGGRGDTVLCETHTWQAQARNGSGTTDAIPSQWVFSAERATELGNTIGSLPAAPT